MRWPAANATSLGEHWDKVTLKDGIIAAVSLAVLIIAILLVLNDPVAGNAGRTNAWSVIVFVIGNLVAACIYCFLEDRPIRDRLLLAILVVVATTLYLAFRV